MTLPDGVDRRPIGGRTRLATRGDPVGTEPAAAGWRAWDPDRSKLAAMYALGMDPGIVAHDTVLYLGAGAGTTVGHVADFAGPVYAVEFAPRPMRDLLAVAEARGNVTPLLKDARSPETYAHVVESNVDVLVQDVATRGQARVAVANRPFLRAGGRLVLAIKARSEDVTATPEAVYDRAVDTLDPAYVVLERERLDRYHTDHLAVIAEPR